MRSLLSLLLIFGLVAGWGPTAPRAQESQESQGSEEEPAGAPKEKVAESPVARGYTYDPAGRRDPFVSPAEQFEQDQGPRPTGILGMRVDEITLTGIIVTPAGSVANIRGSDGKGYLLRIGDRIYRATVVAIDAQAETVTFREQISDPRSIKPYRDRVLRLSTIGTTP